MFLPSHHGWHFANDFASGPVFLEFGDSGAGLCGGMVFSALARFRAGVPMPPDRQAPVPGSARFRELCRWQVASVLRGTPGFVAARLQRDPLAWSLERQVPLVLQALKSGPAPLVLVWTLTLNPWRMAVNHQVLAYGGDDIALRLYDPNYPDDDGVTLEIDRDRRQLRHSYWPNDPLVGVYAPL